MEFMTMVSIVLMMFFLYFLISGMQQRSTYELSVQLNGGEACNRLSSGINLAHNGGDGFSAFILMPYKIKDKDYNVTIENKTVTVQVGGKTVFCRILTSNVDYTPPIAKAQTVEVRNNNGTIQIL
ncbi:MAG: hypothetical protein ABIG20_03345 [archaeon]